MCATVHPKRNSDLIPMITGVGIAKHTEFGELFGRAGQQSRSNSLNFRFRFLIEHRLSRGDGKFRMVAGVVGWRFMSIRLICWSFFYCRYPHRPAREP